MGYRNQTYVVLDYDTDAKWYNLMKAWKEHDKIDFNFYNAHDLNSLRDGSSEDTIKAKLRERMNNAKQVVVLVGERTKFNHKYVRWEQELAIKQGLPIVAANLCGSWFATDKTPPILKEEATFVNVPFGARFIKHALTHFPDEFTRLGSHSKRETRHYDWNKIAS